MKTILSPYLSIFCWLALVTLGQVLSACAKNPRSPVKSEPVASSAPLQQGVIALDSPAAGVSIPLLFVYSGASLSAAAQFVWSSALTDASTGSQLPGCANSTSANVQQYILTCATSGNLTVTLAITDGPTTYRPIVLTTAVQ